MNAKSIILVLVVVSMLLSSLFARAVSVDEILKSRFISDISRSYTTACGDFPQTTRAGYNSYLRSALIYKGQLEVITNVFKQKGCSELGRVEYMKGSIEISDGEAVAFISEKYLVVDQALSEEVMGSMNARLPGTSENIVLPALLNETSKNFTQPNRILYILEIMSAKDEIMQLETNPISTVLHIKSSYGISVLTKK